MWSIVGMAGLAVLTLPITGIEPWLAYPTVLLNLSRPAYVGDAEEEGQDFEVDGDEAEAELTIAKT
jgi:hypothetical protein